jgi:hypothetical protein
MGGIEMGEKLAVDGGKPVIGEKLPGWPWFDEETIEAAMEPLKTGKVNGNGAVKNGQGQLLDRERRNGI